MSHFLGTTGPKTYEERVGRYRILRHEELPEEHKQCLREAGIDPDDNWALIWSFDDRDAAEAQLELCNDGKPDFWTFKLVDNGEASVIERPIY